MPLQCQRLYGSWPLKGNFSQLAERKSNHHIKNCEKQNQGVLTELSSFGSLGRTEMSNAALRVVVREAVNNADSPRPRGQHRVETGSLVS